MKLEVKGGFIKGKEMIKKLRAEHISKRREANKKIKSYAGGSLSELEKELSRINNAIKVYSVRDTLPVRYKGIIINCKTLERFLKKLKNMSLDVEVHEGMFFLKYNEMPGNNPRGRLVLYDLSKYFEGFTDIPELKIHEEG